LRFMRPTGTRIRSPIRHADRAQWPLHPSFPHTSQEVLRKARNLFEDPTLRFVGPCPAFFQREYRVSFLSGFTPRATIIRSKVPAHVELFRDDHCETGQTSLDRRQPFRSLLHFPYAWLPRNDAAALPFRGSPTRPYLLASQYHLLTDTTTFKRYLCFTACVIFG